MTTKRAFNVFLDNFSTTYKLMLYRFIVRLITTCLIIACVAPLMNKVMANLPIAEFLIKIKEKLEYFITGQFDKIGDISALVSAFVEQGIACLKTGQSIIIVMGISVGILYFIQSFLLGLGSFTAASIVNDKMTFQVKTGFMGAMIKNLGTNCLYNLFYTFMSIVYFFISAFLTIGITFFVLTFLPIVLKLTLTVALFIMFMTIKLVWTSNLLPALISGKMSLGNAIKYSFKIPKENIASMLSGFLLLTIIIYTINALTCVLTIGAALVVAVSASYIMIFAYEFANYFDTNKNKYFTDKNTIVTFESNTPQTRENFFKGEANDL